MKTPLTPARADRLLAAASAQLQLDLPASRVTVASTALWGTKAIAQYLGLSADSVRRIMKRDSSFPARVRGGRTYTTRIELLEWLGPREDETV